MAELEEMKEELKMIPLTEEECLNKIVAIGVNSLNVKARTEEETQLLTHFIEDSFDTIMPCWEHLSDAVQFKIFKSHIGEFIKYVKTHKCLEKVEEQE